MLIHLNDEKLNYCGRIDWTKTENPVFVFPATYLQFRFYGHCAEITVDNNRAYWSNFAGALVDGEQKTFSLNEQGETTIELLREEEDHVL